jgi:hypothetical protein
MLIAPTHLRKINSRTILFNNIRKIHSWFMMGAQWHKFIIHTGIWQTLRTENHEIKWCQDNDLLSKKRICIVCTANCRIVKIFYLEGIAWRCPKKGCQKITSIRANSFFSNSNLSITKIFWIIIYLWSRKTPLGKMMMDVEVK